MLSTDTILGTSQNASCISCAENQICIHVGHSLAGLLFAISPKFQLFSLVPIGLSSSPNGNELFIHV